MVQRRIRSRATPASLESRLAAPAANRTDIETKWVDIEELIPYDKNPRNNAQAVSAVAASITDFGFRVPIVVDANNVIVAGHTRYAAAQRLGLTQVPCMVASDLTPDQVRAFRLADNKVASIAKWVPELLAEELQALAHTGLNFISYGWSAEEIDCMTSLVEDDCLSAGTVASLDEANRNPTDPRAPSRSRVVIFEHVFFVEAEVARRWSAALRADFDYSESEVEQELKRRLGLLEYIEAAAH
jgi:hypothetical protein